jgi:hypothetical protein
MALSVVLLKEKFRKLTLDIVHNWDNNTRVRTLIYCLLILLPKQALVPAIFPTYRPPKHPPDLSLVARVNVILVVYLFLPNFPCSPSPCMSPKLCPCFVTPKNLIPLLVRPVFMLFSPFKPLLPVFVRKGRLPPLNATNITLSFKGCTYCPFSIIQAKDSRDLNPRRVAILFGGCNPLN